MNRDDDPGVNAAGAPDQRAPAHAPEETLDPSDWAALRALGHRMVDDMLGHLEHVRERPAWQAIPESALQALDAPVPLEPSPVAAVYEEFQRNVLPYPLGNIHPRFWGWVIGTGTPTGALAEMLAATMNSNVGGGEQSPAHVEQQVIRWFQELLGFPSDSTGILVSGGSMANLVGLTVARNARAEIDVPAEGLAAAPRRMVFYASSETHNSVLKSAGLLGLGRSALRQIPVGDDFRVNLDALRAAITADRAAGCHPFCVVGNAGTVNTGAIDDLEAIADLCARENLWFHADGAFGALAALSPEHRNRVRGIDRADSIAFDLHKWMYMPFEVGCALVRDGDAHRRSFSVSADYLAGGTRGAAGGSMWFSNYGVQLSRGFRALKVWMSLKEHGVRKYGRLIAQNIAQAAYLTARVDAEPELELMAPTALNIVCFRFVAPGLGGEALDGINEEILLELHESGIAVPSSTRLGGRYAIRVANVNHRSRREDFDLLVREVLERGRRLAGLVAG